MTSRIWYQLIDAITRGAFASTVPTSIRRTDDVEIIQEFRETIKASDQAQSPSLFGNINPIQLHVFRTLEDLLNRRLLESSEAMTGLGETEAEALLVEVPPLSPDLTLEAKQLSWTSSENRSQLVITAETLVLESSAAFVNGSGIGKPRTLYCRRQMIAQCNEIFRCSIQTYALLWIVGPTGVGKSCTALAYAYSLEAASWDVIWLHLSRKTPSIACMWLRGNTKMTCTIRKKTLESQLTMLLGSTTHNKKTVVFLDGYVKSIKEEEIASDMCKEWRQNDEYNHRLVCICSMVGRGGDYRPELYETIPSVVDHSDVELYNLERKEETANDECLEAGNGDKLTEDDAKVDEEDTLDEVDEEDTFALESWRIEDYREAINSDSFWESVKDMFPLRHESDGATVEERMQLLEMKYCVAGGSARLMFGVSTKKAVKSLNIAIQEMPNIESFSREFLGASPSGVVHRLLALYHRYDDSGDHDVCLVSDYVVRKAAVVLGPSLLKISQICIE
ncbi:hypothetical protein GN244_ATG07574 [Phytophthora infestans]|uniref:Crinkler (CRN) family protein n=1 Tax=Phytophthora infestans TaxID=4787 RepID=A0A833WKZ3_PHYIN|nr:hypothetical protein GN244_ATG07574 [Phytophthora infestans]